MQSLERKWPIISSLAVAALAVGSYIAELRGQSALIFEHKKEIAELRVEVKGLTIQSAAFDGQAIVNEMKKMSTDLASMNEQLKGVRRDLERLETRRNMSF